MSAESVPTPSSPENKDWKTIVGDLKRLGKEHCEPKSKGERLVINTIRAIKNGYAANVPKVYEAGKEDLPPALIDYFEKEVLG